MCEFILWVNSRKKGKGQLKKTIDDELIFSSNCPTQADIDHVQWN